MFRFLAFLVCFLQAQANAFEHRSRNSEQALKSLGYGDEYSDAHDFLLHWAPPVDLMQLTKEYLNVTVTYSLLAREDNQWAKQVPWEIFLNNVLPYASLSEPRENWRPLFYEKLSPLVKNTTDIVSAFKIINEQVWKIWPAVFKSDQAPLITAPFETMAYGYASCSGMSIFLVNALRSVGVPARVAGTPAWNDADGGNHNWVEVWDGEYWGFTEFQNLELNKTWFYPGKTSEQIPGDYNHSIYAASWEATPQGRYFVQYWDDRQRSTPAFDVTSNYQKGQMKDISSSGL